MTQKCFGVAIAALMLAACGSESGQDRAPDNASNDSQLIDAIEQAVVIPTKQQGPKQKAPADAVDDLFRCSASFNILAVDQPRIESIYQTPLQLRDQFADMATDLNFVSTQRELSDQDANDKISDQLEQIETGHKSGLDPVEIVGYCLGWSENIVRLMETFDPNDAPLDGPHPMIGFFREAQGPSGDGLAAKVSSISESDQQAIRTSFRLWGERGYMNPRKANQVLGNR